MRNIWLAAGLTAALLAGACTGDGGEPGPPGGDPVKIPQPDVGGLDVASDDKRVDLYMPSFSDPTNVTNPLFPVSSQESVLLLGHVDGKPFRTEVTLLPETRIIEWQGQRVETLVSQYMAYLGGRIQEVAYDYYAQADDGSVWYFGEDVADFKDGAIVTTEGTWIAGKDGPAAMIMPADPKVGDAFRTENSPSFAFEEVTVGFVDQELEGPLGTIEGGIFVEELHMDGKVETKTFAPGYGEFITAGGGDVEALALAVPTDAAGGPVPQELVNLESGATDVFDATLSKDWNSASADVEKMVTAWKTYGAGDVPKRIKPRMTAALASLGRAVDARGTPQTRQAAIDVAQWSLDLQLRYRPPGEVDLGRFDLWAAQLLVDAAARDAAGVTGDVFTLDYIRDRIRNTLESSDLARINSHLGELQAAVVDVELSVAADEAAQLREIVAGLRS